MQELRSITHAVAHALPRQGRIGALVVLAGAPPAAALIYAGAAPLAPHFAWAALALSLGALLALACTVRVPATVSANALPPPPAQTDTRHAATNLPLRETLLAAMTQELAFSSKPAVLGLLRVANFQNLFAFDAEAADRVLAVLARRLSAAVDPSRPVAQVDRDCFAVWFSGVTSPEDAAAHLEALSYLLSREVPEQKLVITPDIQIGAALFPIDADEPASLLNRAFVSLARPQRTAEGGLAFFAKPSAQQARRRFFLEQDLRHAVRRRELALHYQPFVDIAQGRVVGAEALMRWESPHHVMISPSQIVPVLEETGLVHEFGLWAFNAACRQLRDWCAEGHDLKIAVNLSVRQLRDPTLPSAFKQIVASHGLSPGQIELELTETAAMEDAASTLALFEQLREMGFSLAIDDFGSGYSSLAYLRRLPFQKLKIDREFVTHLDERADSRSICRALIDLTAGLELSVLAEGVERWEEVEALTALGCSTFQGFYFARPASAREFIAVVSDPNWLARLRSPVLRRQDDLKRRLS